MIKYSFPHPLYLCRASLCPLGFLKTIQGFSELQKPAQIGAFSHSVTTETSSTWSIKQGRQGALLAPEDNC